MIAPRTRALEHMFDVRHVVRKGDSLDCNPFFREVPAALVQKPDWVTERFVKLNDSEAMHIKEMRAMLSAIRDKLIHKDSWGKRHVSIGDN